VVNYRNIVDRADGILDLLLANDGRFPRPDRPQQPGHQPLPDDISPEIPFETRFFTVRLDAQGRILATDTGSIAAVTTEQAASMAAEVYAKDSLRGFLGDYKYASVDAAPGRLIVFLDCSRDLGTFRTFLATSVVVSLAGMLAVLLLVLLFSRIVVRPVAQTYEKQKRFITDASHEIKTPLAIIDADIEVIAMEGGESEWTKSIRNQVSRLSRLTGNLVSLARMEEESSRMAQSAFSLSDAVSETAEPFAALASTQTHPFTWDIEPGLSCFGDESLIRELVSILLDNAFKYAKDNGSVTLLLKRRGKRAALTIQNEADTVPEGDLEVLFDRFYRQDRSRHTGAGGYGIGLSLARSIVEAHHGRIEARAADGPAMAFVVIL